jgi:hypothetical protein
MSRKLIKRREVKVYRKKKEKIHTHTCMHTYIRKYISKNMQYIGLHITIFMFERDNNNKSSLCYIFKHERIQVSTK